MHELLHNNKNAAESRIRKPGPRQVEGARQTRVICSSVPSLVRSDRGSATETQPRVRPGLRLGPALSPWSRPPGATLFGVSSPRDRPGPRPDRGAIKLLGVHGPLSTMRSHARMAQLAASYTRVPEVKGSIPARCFPYCVKRNSASVQ